jgi:hypothetical protein
MLTGCATAEQPRPARSSAPPAGPAAFYTGLSSECPALKSPESVRFTGSRTGRHHRIPPQKIPFDRVDCGWRPSSGEAPWVTVTVSLYLDPATAHEKAERWFDDALDFSLNRAQGIPSQAVRVAERATPHGPAFVVADSSDNEVTDATDHLEQTTLVENAIITVTLIEKRDPAHGGSTRADELMTGLTATSEAITDEVARHLASRT